MHRTRFSNNLSLIALCGFAGILPGFSQSSSSEGKPVSTVSNASPDQTNVATQSFGAKHGNVRGSTTNFGELIQGKPDTVASLTPAPNGAIAITTIDLPKTVNLDRVVLDLSKSKGRLVVIAMSDKGEALDLTTPEGASRVIADRKLSGAESEVTFDASKISAKSVMLYWVPDEPGGALTLSGLGLFSSAPGALPVVSANTDKTRSAETQSDSAPVATTAAPEAAAVTTSAPVATTAAPEAAAVTTPVPVMPSPEVLASVMVTVGSSTSKATVAPAASNSGNSNSNSGATKGSDSANTAATSQLAPGTPTVTATSTNSNAISNSSGASSSSSSTSGSSQSAPASSTGSATSNTSTPSSNSGGGASPNLSVTSQASRPAVLPPVIQPASQPVSL